MTLAFVILVLSTTIAHAQHSDFAEESFNEHYNRGRELMGIADYAQAINELEVAIKVAKENNWEKRQIDVSITLAELLRKTHAHDASLELLNSLTTSEKFPKLHVRKLGRIAAYYHERKLPSEVNQFDSVRHYLDSALFLSEQFGDDLLIASLLNELGCLVSRHESYAKGQPYLLKAADLFLQEGDTANYTVAMYHVVDNLIELKELEKADSITEVLLGYIEGKNWYDIEIDLFYFAGKIKKRQNDSLTYLKWKVREKESLVARDQKVHSQQMSFFRVSQQTEKYQVEAKESAILAERKAKELEKQAARTKELIIGLSLLVLLVFGVIALLLRERTLKSKMAQMNDQLSVANEKYQLLLVESNHRIKNNLQMIISMLQYASKDLDEENFRSLEKMTSKIHTISSLHKHLYSDVHNVRVSLEAYFAEIIKLYEEMGTLDFSVNKHIEKVEIESERIVYFGLILNELLSNTIEHGKEKAREVDITVNRVNENFVFTYIDGSLRDRNAQEGMGSLLIKQLVKRIEGTDFSIDLTRGIYRF